ncbi:MAG: outer membrane protein transport protein [Thiobacillus sp.]|nr:outer membrane protein transport protein [Thiobacillus sp.]
MMKLKVLVGAMALATAGSACATNGYFLPGFGFRSQGMGGVGIAYGRDSLSTAANPANAVNTGMRGDMGIGVFNPERNASVGPGTGLSGGDNDFTPGGGGAFGFTGNTESDAKYFLMPEMGFSMPLTENLHVAMAVVGNGGMNTTYPQNFFAFGGLNPSPDKKIGVDMMQLLVPISLAYRVNETHSLGASLVLAETRFRAYGLEAFANFAGVPSDPKYVTGNGFDYSYGAGFKLGWLGEFMDDKLTVGLTYASRTWMSKFDKYKSLFAEQGDFDIPENYGIGVAFKPVKNLVIAADVVRINYNDIASIGNRGPGFGVNKALLGTDGVPSLLDSNKQLGKDQGMGFGWENQTVYKLGVQYGVNNRLLLRAGYNYGKTPIDQVTFNLLAPATVEKHYSLGFTYKANDLLEVTGTYMYAASNSQTACNQNIVDCASFNMHQNLFALSMGWVLDPGPKSEYGESDWAGINFDGWYGGFGFGQSRYRNVASYINAEVGPQAASTTANSRSEGWKVYTGYQVNKYLGVEGGYANLNDVSATTGSRRTNVVSDAWTLAAVGTLPVTNKLSVIGKLGAAYVLADIRTKNGTALTKRSGDDSYEPYYGMGVSYALLKNLDLRAEWERFDRKDLNIDLMTAGMTVKF